MAESRIESKSVSNGVVVDLTGKKPILALHVDDDPVFLKAAKQCLEMQGGFQVDPALSVNEAVEKMKTKTYDVIICDYAMPEKDGLKFLKELRDSGNRIPFIMLNGKGREEVAIQAFNSGADQYINKIGTPETAYSELAHGIRRVIESRRTEEELRASENYLKSLMASILAGVIVVDAETHKIVDANPQALKTIGAPREHVVGKECYKFICLGENEKCPVSDLGQSEEKSERVLLKADGERIPILKSVVATTWKGRRYTVESFVDITERKQAERALRESQEKFERLFLNSPEAAVYVDSNFLILDANPRFSELFEYSLDEIKGKRTLDFIVPENKKAEAEMLDRKTIEAHTYQDAVRKKKDGTLVAVSISAAPIIVEDQFVGYVGLYTDITERKSYENSLSALNAYSRNLNMSKSMEEIYELTLDAAEKALGFRFADILIVEGNILRMVNNRGRSKNLSIGLPLSGEKGITARAARTGKSVLVPNICKEEAYIEFGAGILSELAVPIKIGNRVLGVLNVESKKLNAFNEKDQELLEILASHAATAMSKVEYSRSLETYAQEIRESQQKFERLFTDNPEAVVHLDPDSHVLSVNPRFTRLFGYSLDEIRGKHINDVIVPKDKMEEGEMLDKKALKGYVDHDTARKRKDGAPIEVSVSAAPITDEGKITGYIVTYKDVTERKRYEERLSALNVHSQKLNTAESMEEIYLLTMDAVEKTLGFAIAFFMVVDKDKLRIVDHRGYPASFSYELPLDGSKRGVAIKVAKTGRTINVSDVEKEDDWVEFMPGIRSGLDVPVKVEHKILGVIGVDSREVNAFDKKDQQLVEILASHAATAMSNLDRAKKSEAYAREIRESQQKFERLFTDNPEAALHLDSNFHIMNVNPRFTRLFGYFLDEIRGKHINDVIVPKDRMEEAVVFDERASKGEIYHEDTVRMRKDGSLVPVSFSAAPITVENQVVGHIAVYKDISQLKKAEEELKQTSEKLAKINEKLRVIGGLTRHDARNKLSTITGNAYVARRKSASNSEVLDNLEEIEVAVREIVRIFDFAKTYEMLGVEELQYMDVEKMVNEAVSLFSDLKGVKVFNNCHGLMARADSLLRQLFYNLVDNSLKYGEKIKTITVYYEEIDKNKLKLVYEDDGVGIAEAEKKKLFQEGYGRGTGYGLYLIRKMCEGYGWSIQETGKEGQGAQFTITVPRIGEKRETNYSVNQPAIM